MTNRVGCAIIVKRSEEKDENAAMAQLVEHILGKDEVISSNLISSSRQPRGIASGLWFLLACIISKKCSKKSKKGVDKRKGMQYNG